MRRWWQLRGQHIERSRQKSRKARSKAWSEKNRDKCAARSARYRQRHPDRVKAYSDANKDAQRVRGENWQKRNPEKARQKTAEYQRLHPEVGVEYRAKKRAHLDAAIQRWRDRNPEYRAGANARRRGRLVAAGGSHTVHEIAELMVRQGGRCANPFCGVEIHTKNKALDHIMPLALGGGNGIENLQWLCQPCNSRKSAIHPDRWLEKEAKLISSRV